MEEHLGHLLHQEGDRPGEQVQEIGQQIRVRALHELLDVQGVVDELYHRCLVLVVVAVVGRRKYGDHRRELLLPTPLVHFEALWLGLVGPD